MYLEYVPTILNGLHVAGVFAERKMLHCFQIAQRLKSTGSAIASKQSEVRSKQITDKFLTNRITSITELSVSLFLFFFVIVCEKKKRTKNKMHEFEKRPSILKSIHVKEKITWQQQMAEKHDESTARDNRQDV